MKTLKFFAMVAVVAVSISSCGEKKTKEVSLIDSYDQWANKYVSCLKEVAKEDRSALKELEGLMEEGLKLSEVLDSTVEAGMSRADMLRAQGIYERVITETENLDLDFYLDSDLYYETDFDFEVDFDFDLDFYLDEDDEEAYDEDNEDEEEVVETKKTNSQDWDEVLNSYEKYVDKYISYMKKAVAGDMAALAEYPALLEEAQELCDKLDKAQNDMSTSQVNRYLKITKKMTDAALEMVPSSSSSDLDLDFDIDF